jgi:hypothetical protein
MVRGIRRNKVTDPSERSAAANPQTRRDDEPKHGGIQLLPQGYNTMKARIQQDQIVKAGARLAQILKQIWPD